MRQRLSYHPQRNPPFMMGVDFQPTVIEAEDHVIKIQRLVVAAHGHDRTGKSGAQYAGRAKTWRAGGMKADTLKIIRLRFRRGITGERRYQRDKDRSPKQGFHLHSYLCHGWQWQRCRKNNVSN